jgi:hypothetical protein
LLAALVMGQDGKVLAAESRDVGLGEADDGHPPRGGVAQESVDRLEPFLDRRRIPRGRQTDT